MTESESEAIVALVKPISAMMEHLPIDHRICLLEGLLMQKVCNLPLSERDDELARIRRDLPMMLDATERGMREALVMNAKEGL